MRTIVMTVLLLLLACGATGAQSLATSSPELEEATRLNADVVKLFNVHKYQEALPIARRVVELREKALGGEHLQVAYALNNLASTYVELKKGGEAEPLFRRALAILDKAGVESDLAADINTQLGVMRRAKREYKESEPFMRRALEIREKVHGADNPAVVPALFNLADIYFIGGNFEYKLAEFYGLNDEFEVAHTLLGRAVSILLRQPPKKDAGLVQRLQGYLCPLMGRSSAKDDELAGKVTNAIWRLKEPESAAEYEKSQKEQGARSGGEKQIVEGGVLNGHSVTKPAPKYPEEAKREGISGTVVVQITVDESGKVIKAEPLCGHPLLAKAAADAALAARFTPTLLSDRPVKVSGVITYNFVYSPLR